METIVREFKLAAATGGNILDRINSVEDAYGLMGLERGKVLEINAQGPLKKLAEQLLDLADLTIICNVVNEDWVADYSDASQYKYYAWLRYTPGSGFAFADSGCDHVCASLGARPALKSAALAKAVYEKFPELCNRVASFNSKQG